jgi:serine/threonine-protein kinase
MPPRTLLAVAGWLAAAVVATVIGVAALRLVGASIAGTPGGVLSQQEVERRLAAATTTSAAPAGVSPTPASPSASTSPGGGESAQPAPSAPQKVFRARGGSAVAECRGTAARLVSWWPAPGFATHEVERGPAAEAEVDFRGPAGRSKIEVHCADGQPVAEYDDR